MTNVGYDQIIRTVENLPVPVPTGLTANELSKWLDGWKAATGAMKDVLKDLKKGNELR